MRFAIAVVCALLWLTIASNRRLAAAGRVVVARQCESGDGAENATHNGADDGARLPPPESPVVVVADDRGDRHDRFDVDGVASRLVDWIRSAWNAGITLRVNVADDGGQRDETLASVRFGDTESTAAHGEVGRTFGIRRRMQLFFLLPISFKLGIIMTLLLVLTAMSFKTLIIGFVILLLLLNHVHGGHAKLWGAPKYHELSSDSAHKNIHIHVHNSPAQDHHYGPYAQPWHEPEASHAVVYSA